MPLETPTAPTPTAPATPERSTAPSIDDFDKHFDGLEAAEPSTTPEPAEPTPTPEPKTTTPKDPVSGKFTKAEPKVEPKAEPKPESKPKVEQDEYTPPQVATGSSLRRFAEKAGADARRLSNELNSVRAELAQLKSQPNTESKHITAELADARKRIQEYERELQTTRYERSAEYKEKYEAPYQNAVRQAYADIKELVVYDQNPEDPEHPRERQATGADFDEVYNLPLGAATRLAKQKFGDSAPIVLQHRAAIKNAAKAALEAVDQRKNGAEQYFQQQEAQQKMQEEGRAQMFSTAINDIRSKHSAMFEKEGDPQWGEDIAKGKAMADMAFSDRQGMTEQQKVILDAHIYNRLVLAPALMREVTRLRAENKKLSGDLAQRLDSSPGKVQPTGKSAPSGPRTWEQEFDEKVKE